MERIRILTVKIMMFCILIGSCLGMMAVFVQAEEDIPGVIFENSRNEAPDLYIKKQVKTAMEGYDPPEDQEFSFVLKLDGELAKRLEYRECLIKRMRKSLIGISWGTENDFRRTVPERLH